MSVKIIIQRKFKNPLVQENLRAIEALRIGAMRQKGYVSGETLVNFAFFTNKFSMNKKEAV